MTLRLVSAPPSFSLFTCRATVSTTLPPPTPTPASSIPQSPPLTCSGCTHEFNLHRPVILDDATDFFRKHGVSDFTFDTCKLWGWRCRAKLAVRGSSMDPLIGLYEEGTHNVVDIPQCKAHHPNINAAVELLRRGITELGVEPYIEDEGTGDLRYVQMAVTTYNTSLPAAERYKNGKVQVTLVWNSRNENSPGSDKLNALANFLWKNGGPRSRLHLIHSVWANFQTSTNNIIFGNRWRHLLGERDFWEHVGGIDVSLAPSSFGQANTRAFDALLRKLQKYVPYESAVADFYAGAGVIGLSLAATRKCRSVKCIEINKESKASFEKTIERLPATVDSSITWHHADASKVAQTQPRKRKDHGFYVQKKLQSRLEANLPPTNIPQSVPQTLIYISCGWESFKEDCKSLLSSKAWYLEKAHGFNFFPGTQSIEVLAVFKRGPQKKKPGKKKKKHLQGAVRH
ncbi:methyltransferase protein [Spatholobus suberectus]|nr:methyltransferase protein [Spatholobus suberectus]